MPNYENRLDILKTILKSNKFSVAEDVDLGEIARKAAKFSGADLQALIYNSYLKAVHEDLAKKEKLMQENNKDEGTVDYFVSLTTKQSAIQSSVTNLGERLRSIRMNKKESGIGNSAALNRGLYDNGVKNDHSRNVANNSKKVVLKAGHFKQGLLETNRSISNKQIKKLDQIYEKFTENRRAGDLRDGEASQNIGERTTLM